MRHVLGGGFEDIVGCCMTVGTHEEGRSMSQVHVGVKMDACDNVIPPGMASFSVYIPSARASSSVGVAGSSSDSRGSASRLKTGDVVVVPPASEPCP